MSSVQHRLISIITSKMKAFAGRLYNAFEYQLNEITFQQSSECARIKESIKLCQKAMIILKRQLSVYCFENMNEEICFFKQIKPLFYSQYIYYISLYNFQINQPTGSEQTFKDYISSQLEDLKRFFDHNQTFYQYYRTSSSHLDHLYFTRNGFEVFTELEDFQGDELFSTSHDYKLAKIIANEKFQEYLHKQMKTTGQNTAAATQSPIIWTSNQTDLVELIYALVESGAFNNGNVEIKCLMDYFQTIFQVDLKSYYRKYTDISNRKKERTAFLDKLKSSLIRRMDEKIEFKEPQVRRVHFNLGSNKNFTPPV